MGVIIHAVDADEVINLPEGMEAYESAEGMTGDAWPLQPVINWAVIDDDGNVTNIIRARGALPGINMVAIVTDDPVRIGDVYDGESFSTPPPPVPTVDEYTRAVQRHLDETAGTRGYDGILSAASYAGSLHPRFGAEGTAFRNWRDAVWSHCYDVLGGVQAEQRAAPTVAELIAELPAVVLP